MKTDYFSKYLELLNLCLEGGVESHTTDVAIDLKDLFKIFTNSNAHTNKYLQNAFSRPIYDDVKTVNWNPDKRLICFGSPTSLLSSKAIEQMIEEDEEFWEGV